MSYTMLIVDDSRVSRMFIKSFTQEQHPDWLYLEAASGAEAIEIAKANALNLITMDLNMPGIDGIETGLQIKALQPDCIITLLTANIQTSTQERAANAGFHFLPKPITPVTISKLLAIVGD